MAAREKSDTVMAVILRDYWPTGDDLDRVRAGTVQAVTKDELIAGMESGVMKRVDPEAN